MEGFTIPHYRFLRKIGQSNASQVFLAEHDENGKSYAVKVLDYAHANQPSHHVIRRFEQEYQFQSDLRHPHIVQIHDRIARPGYISHVMEYFPAGDMSQRLQQGYDTWEVIGHFLQIMSAMEHIHDLGIVHLDLKPKNILYRQDNSIALADFGIAAHAQIGQALCPSDTIMGSPYYMSPEQIDNACIDPRSDLYSLGVIFYEMLSGEKPFAGGNLIQIFSAHLNKPVPTLPHEVLMYQPIIDGLLAKHITDRFQSIRELREALLAIDFALSEKDELISA